jgi:cytosine/adenosine deaminase-related metal-dependent hydrolase
VGFEALPDLPAANSEVAARFFDEPLLGQIVDDAPADIAVIDAPPATPLTVDNLFGHLMYGAAEARVRHTIARGRVVMEDFRLLTVDLEETAREARSISQHVWNRFQHL